MTPQEKMRSKEIIGEVYFLSEVVNRCPTGTIKIDDAITILEAYGEALLKEVIIKSKAISYENKLVLIIDPDGLRNLPEPDMEE